MQSISIKKQASATASPAPSMAKTKSAEGVADTSGDNGDSSDFVGKSFTQAQDKILEEMIQYVDEDGELEIFTPFVNLPPRNLADYYQVIKYPTSLKGLQRRVRGVQGRGPPTWVSEFKSWDSFSKEASYIWQNAREYNEDGSEIFDLAGELEEAFRRRLADAKAVVEQPPQIKLKINAPAIPKIPIKLSFNRTAHSPSTPSQPGTPADGRGTPGVIVDNEALLRQQQMVAAATTNGQRPSSAAGAVPAVANRPPFNAARSASASATIAALNARYPNNSAQSPSVHTNGYKSEAHPPALSSLRTSSQLSLGNGTGMPPPQNSLLARHSSGSPHPQGPMGHQPQQQYHAPPPVYQGPLQSLLDNKLRAPGQSKFLIHCTFTWTCLTITQRPRPQSCRRSRSRHTRSCSCRTRSA